MTFQKSPTSANPASAYEANFVPAIFRPWSEELFRRATPGPGDRVLDVACGSGIIARQVAPMVGSDGSVTGLDFNASMLEVARSIPLPPGLTIQWREGSAEQLPFEDGSFDLVLCQQGLRFVPDKLAAVREMHRVLAPGGQAVVAVWLGLEHQLGFAIVHGAMDRHIGQGAGDPFSLGDAAELQRFFEEAEFRDVAVEAVTRQVHFPSADGYVRMVVQGASAVIPELKEMDDAARRALIEAIRNDVGDSLAPLREGDGLVFPMSSHIVLAAA